MEIISYIGYATLSAGLIFLFWYHHTGRAKEDDNATRILDLYRFDKPITTNNNLDYEKVLYDDFKGLEIFTSRSKAAYLKKIDSGKVDLKLDYQKFSTFRQWHIDRLSSYFSETPIEIEKLLVPQINLLDQILIRLNPNHKVWDNQRILHDLNLIEHENQSEIYDLGHNKMNAFTKIDPKVKLDLYLKNGLNSKLLLEICKPNGEFIWDSTAHCKNIGHLIFFLNKYELFTYSVKYSTALAYADLFNADCTDKAITPHMNDCPEELLNQFRKIFGRFLEG